MGRDGFPYRWDTCRLGDGYTFQCSTVSLNVELLHLHQHFSFLFFEKIFGSLCYLFFILLGVLLVRESSCFGDRLYGLLFTAASSSLVSQLPLSFF